MKKLEQRFHEIGPRLESIYIGEMVWEKIDVQILPISLKVGDIEKAINGIRKGRSTGLFKPGYNIPSGINPSSYSVEKSQETMRPQFKKLFGNKTVLLLTDNNLNKCIEECQIGNINNIRKENCIKRLILLEKENRCLKKELVVMKSNKKPASDNNKESFSKMSKQSLEALVNHKNEVYDLAEKMTAQKEDYDKKIGNMKVKIYMLMEELEDIKESQEEELEKESQEEEQ